MLLSSWHVSEAHSATTFLEIPECCRVVSSSEIPITVLKDSIQQRVCVTKMLDKMDFGFYDFNECIGLQRHCVYIRFVIGNICYYMSSKYRRIRRTSLLQNFQCSLNKSKADTCRFSVLVTAGRLPGCCFDPWSFLLVHLIKPLSYLWHSVKC